MSLADLRPSLRLSSSVLRTLSAPAPALHTGRCSRQRQSVDPIRRRHHTPWHLNRPLPSQRHPFHTSAALYKKKSRSKGADDYYEEEDDDTQDSSNSSKKPTAQDDPYDFSDLETGIAQAQERLQTSISTLRPGGRLSPEVVEAVRVKLPSSESSGGSSSGSGSGSGRSSAHSARDKSRGKPDAGKAASKEGGGSTVRLGELAQVVPKSGRTLALLLTSAAHAKPITSALLGSPLALNATPAPGSDERGGDDGLELHVAVPPPTQESRNQAKKQADEAGEKSLAAIRNARQAMHKRHRSMEIAKTARTDDLRKAATKMEDIVKQGNGKIKKTVEAAKKAMDG